MVIEGVFQLSEVDRDVGSINIHDGVPDTIGFQHDIIQEKNGNATMVNINSEGIKEIIKSTNDGNITYTAKSGDNVVSEAEISKNPDGSYSVNGDEEMEFLSERLIQREVENTNQREEVVSIYKINIYNEQGLMVDTIYEHNFADKNINNIDYSIITKNDRGFLDNEDQINEIVSNIDGWQSGFGVQLLESLCNKSELPDNFVPKIQVKEAKNDESESNIVKVDVKYSSIYPATFEEMQRKNPALKRMLVLVEKISDIVEQKKKVIENKGISENKKTEKWKQLCDDEEKLRKFSNSKMGTIAGKLLGRQSKPSDKSI